MFDPRQRQFAVILSVPEEGDNTFPVNPDTLVS